MRKFVVVAAVLCVCGSTHPTNWHAIGCGFQQPSLFVDPAWGVMKLETSRPRSIPLFVFHPSIHHHRGRYSCSATAETCSSTYLQEDLACQPNKTEANSPPFCTVQWRPPLSTTDRIGFFSFLIGTQHICPFDSHHNNKVQKTGARTIRKALENHQLSSRTKIAPRTTSLFLTHWIDQ